MCFVVAILSNIKMDKCLHKKDTERDESNYNKNSAHYYYILVKNSGLK